MADIERAYIAIENDGNILVAAYSLRADSWYDARSFLAEARLAGASGDARGQARHLRAALLFLFAHLEAVLKEATDTFSFSDKSPLLGRIAAVEQRLKSLGVPMPPLDLHYEKHLRDITAHLGVTKNNFPGR
jgi:hypothetical protein